MRITQILSGAAVIAATLVVPSLASAQVGRGRNFGLGLAVGYPNVGLSGNVLLGGGGGSSIQFTASFRYHNRHYGSGLFLRGDYLFYPATLVRASAFDLKFYFGPGVNLGLGVGNGRGFFLGAELPVGLTFQFSRVPLDVALEAVPVLEILNGDNGELGFGIGGAAHVRYYF